MWYYLLIFIFAGVSILTLCFGNLDIVIKMRDGALVGRVFLVCNVFLLVPPIFSTSYLVTDTELAIKAGLFRKTISLKSIEKACSIYSALSSPFAFSFSRTRIFYKNKKGKIRFFDISPKEREKFETKISNIIK